MNENRKMTSIARSIHVNFWFRRFWGLIWLDILIFFLVLGTYMYWNIDHLPDQSGVKKVDFELDGKYRDFKYIIYAKDGEIFKYNMYEFYDYLLLPSGFLAGFEVLYIIGAMGGTGSIRRKMKPLNELARRAEELSTVSFNYSKFEDLEAAINNVSGDISNAKIETDDKDLQSIEVAINNLIARMRESQKQQNRFVSDASHELRTPISVIQGYVNMLDRWGKKDENVLEEGIEAIKNESQHMKELIEQLLFLARGDSGRNTLKYEVINLNSIMEEVWEESLMIDEEHQYVFEKCEDAFVNGDVAMIKQSARIFIQNAAKYSGKGNIIKIKVKSKDNKVCYIIQDEGIGMSQEDVSHIFERFYRSDEARNGNTGGSGLGLSIAKWIIDAHDGTIDVISKEEIGTRFTVAFNAVQNV